MAIANSYPIDKDIEAQDLLIGTKYSNRQTVNFPVDSLVDYLNNKGKISIAGQMSWKFVMTSAVQGSISFIDLGGNNTPFSSVTRLRVAVNDLAGDDVVGFLNYLVGSQIMISYQKEISSFGHYKITAYAPDVMAAFYILDVEYIGGEGRLFEDNVYNMNLFIPFADSDKTDVFVQDVPLATWDINHGLNKYPSVSVVGVDNNVAYGNVVYIDQNNLRIEFSIAFAGKAFMN